MSRQCSFGVLLFRMLLFLWAQSVGTSIYSINLCALVANRHITNGTPFRNVPLSGLNKFIEHWPKMASMLIPTPSQDSPSDQSETGPFWYRIWETVSEAYFCTPIRHPICTYPETTLLVTPSEGVLEGMNTHISVWQSVNGTLWANRRKVKNEKTENHHISKLDHSHELLTPFIESGPWVPLSSRMYQIGVSTWSTLYTAQSRTENGNVRFGSSFMFVHIRSAQFIRV